jgi:hypothetical protein
MQNVTPGQLIARDLIDQKYGYSPPNWTPGTQRGWRRYIDPATVAGLGAGAGDFARGVGESPIGQSLKGMQIPGMARGVTAAGAGKLFGRSIPYLPVATNLLEGDVKGAAYSGVGGFLGGRLTGAAMGAKAGPWGALAGAILGEPVFRGIEGMAGNVIGLGNPNDPLSGNPDAVLNIFGRKIPLSQYAKTKQQMSRQAELRKEFILPVIQQIQDAQHQRAIEMTKLGMLNNMMSSTNSLMAAAIQS